MNKAKLRSLTTVFSITLAALACSYLASSADTKTRKTQYALETGTGTLGGFTAAEGQAPAPAVANSSGTAADQNLSDWEITRRVRLSIVGDQTLSTAAHNVRITSKNGKVTLKGGVTSETEKLAVGVKAAELVGTDNVKNNLTVK